jgi:hypothetical protein
MKSVSPSIPSPSSAQVTTGYFGDLAATGWFRLNTHHLNVIEQGFLRIGPPSKAATCGTAADKKIPATPNIRMAILIAFFMGKFLLLRLGFPKWDPVAQAGIIRHESSPFAGVA